jgi:hypothetical protein
MIRLTICGAVYGDMQTDISRHLRQEGFVLH